MNQKGQVLVGVILLMMILSIVVPAMVMYTQRESQWTAKQSNTTAAFHLAEAGTEKALLALSQSTLTWKNLQDFGTGITGYKFDTAYTDVPGGRYIIAITSGPMSQQATVISIGQDSLRKETRSLKVVYSNGSLGNIAVLGGNGVDVSGNNLTVEWGAIISPNSITSNGANHPTYWSAGNIDLDPNGATPPNCDTPNCWRWHSYYNGIPPLPTIDFAFYKSSAQASGTGPCGDYYQSGNFTYNCTDYSGKPYYVEGSMEFSGFISGAVLVLGNFSTPNGNLGGITRTVAVPQEAWKQYPDDWAFYKATYETTNPYASFPGPNATYLSPSTLTYAISDLSIEGLLYVGGDFIGPNGGGNSNLVYGVIYVKGTVSLNSNSHVKVFYGAAAASNLQLSKLVLTRSSWQDVLYQWPSNVP